MADTANNIALATTSSRHLTETQKVKLQKATREFESIFVQMMLSSMRSAQGEETNEFGGESFGGDTMKGMFDTELSKHIGSQGKLGIAESLYRKLTGDPLPAAGAIAEIPESFSAKHHTSRGKSAGEHQESAALRAVRSVQPLNEFSDDANGAVDANMALLSLTSAMERLQPSSVPPLPNAGAVQPSPASDSEPRQKTTPSHAPAPASAPWTSTTIQANLSSMPPTPRTERPERAALTASAGMAAEPGRRDASKTVAELPGKNQSAAFDRVKSYDAIIARTADTVGVDANLLKAMIVEESGGRQHARSSRNAKGLMQLIDTTAESMGVKNVWDPLQNIQGGARYLKQQLQKFNGDISLALASYNAGPGNVEKYNGIPPFRETRNYVKRVMNLFSAFQSMERKSDDVIE